jgi:hypothetical protein
MIFLTGAINIQLNLNVWLLFSSVHILFDQAVLSFGYHLPV